MLLDNLEGLNDPESQHYMSQEQAYEVLRRWTGEDFGYDVGLWSEWLVTHTERKMEVVQAMIDVLPAPAPPQNEDDIRPDESIAEYCERLERRGPAGDATE
jgi:hypothetical protein